MIITKAEVAGLVLPLLKVALIKGGGFYHTTFLYHTKKKFLSHMVYITKNFEKVLKKELSHKSRKTN